MINLRTESVNEILKVLDVSLSWGYVQNSIRVPSSPAAGTLQTHCEYPCRPATGILQTRYTQNTLQVAQKRPKPVLTTKTRKNNCKDALK